MKSSLTFNNHPDLKIGFSTQNFQKAMPFNVESLIELFEYGSEEGYNFIMIRDDLAKLTENECEKLAGIARKNNLDIIYEIHKNPLDSGYQEIFEKGLRNLLLFKGPGILRTIVSKSEFDNDPHKKGWTNDELARLGEICDRSAAEARKSKIKYIIENFNEAFFGDGQTYYGIADLFRNTIYTGLQFDISNPFRNTSRDKADPERVVRFLKSIGNRWITSHLKTILEGEMQAVLTENPITVEKIVDLMGSLNIPWVALELAGDTDKQQCYINHSFSIKYLRDRNILK